MTAIPLTAMFLLIYAHEHHNSKCLYVLPQELIRTLRRIVPTFDATTFAFIKHFSLINRSLEMLSCP